MPRLPRGSAPGGLFHVTTHSVDETTMCTDDADYERFLRVLAPVVEQGAWICHFVVVMANHYRLLVRAELEDLAGGMAVLNGRYAKLYNRDHGRRGHLFRARYYSGPIEDDSHLLETIRYIALNPVRAGNCKRPEDWRWGTYRATLGLDRAPPCLALSAVLSLFAGTETSARVALHGFVLGGLAVEP